MTESLPVWLPILLVLIAGLTGAAFWKGRALASSEAAESFSHYRESESLLRDRLVESEHKVEVQTEWIDVQDRKIREQFDVIRGVLVERDRWKNWYEEASFLYGNAQHMLMGELERIAAAAKVQVSPKIREIQATITERAQAVRIEAPKMVTPEMPLPLDERPTPLRPVAPEPAAEAAQPRVA